jgi:hypothetical protein
MKRQKGQASSGGVGVLGLLGVVFITLKLIGVTEVATWSWWWVTAPLWGGAVLVLLIVAICIAIGVWAESR